MSLESSSVSSSPPVTPPWSYLSERAVTKYERKLIELSLNGREPDNWRATLLVTYQTRQLDKPFIKTTLEVGGLVVRQPSNERRIVGSNPVGTSVLHFWA